MPTTTSNASMSFGTSAIYNAEYSGAWTASIFTKKFKNYLCVGGPYNGTETLLEEGKSTYLVQAFSDEPTAYIQPYAIGGAVRFRMPAIVTVKYTRRKFSNQAGETFSVLAPEDLPGYKVLMMLAKGDYKNNPLKQK